jgi:hypothetical protein
MRRCDAMASPPAASAPAASPHTRPPSAAACCPSGKSSTGSSTAARAPAAASAARTVSTDPVLTCAPLAACQRLVRSLSSVSAVTVTRRAPWGVGW